MILGIGSDIVKVSRIEELAKRFGSKFEERLFTASEIAKANARSADEKTKFAFLAKRFAAKEACAKALGTGIGEHAKWTEISVSNLDNGAPVLHLSGSAAERLEKMTPKGMKAQHHLSLSDEQEMALAFVVISASPL